jgi:hypothetical protein
MVAALIVGLSGCSEPKFYPARGKIIVYGVGPLKEGEIQIRPKARPNLVATGKIQKDGTFSVSTPGHGEGVLEGDCQVAIVSSGTATSPPRISTTRFCRETKITSFWT